MLDEKTRAKLHHHHRDLEALGDYLLDYYAKVVDAAGMTGKAPRRRAAFPLADGL